MSSSERTRILHVVSQIPKLLQSNSGDIYNVITLCDGCSWELSIGERGA